nr:MAG TPA: hypothetical protein [Bacteriophage sp.]DAW06797.1 MAG TPA: hypothetical protein [Bacteriophage sp.]
MLPQVAPAVSSAIYRIAAKCIKNEQPHRLRCSCSFNISY